MHLPRAGQPVESSGVRPEILPTASSAQACAGRGIVRAFIEEG